MPSPGPDSVPLVYQVGGAIGTAFAAFVAYFIALRRRPAAPALALPVEISDRDAELIEARALQAMQPVLTGAIAGLRSELRAEMNAHENRHRDTHSGFYRRIEALERDQPRDRRR